MCAILASILEQCSLLLPLLWGAGPMALMLWLDGMMMMMMMHGDQPSEVCPCNPSHYSVRKEAQPVCRKLGASSKALEGYLLSYPALQNSSAQI
jgi:hypothetical protein